MLIGRRKPYWQWWAMTVPTSLLVSNALMPGTRQPLAPTGCSCKTMFLVDSLLVKPYHEPPTPSSPSRSRIDPADVHIGNVEALIKGAESRTWLRSGAQSMVALSYTSCVSCVCRVGCETRKLRNWAWLFIDGGHHGHTHALTFAHELDHAFLPIPVHERGRI